MLPRTVHPSAPQPSFLQFWFIINVTKYFIRNISDINTAPTSEIRGCDVVVVVAAVGRITDLLWPKFAQNFVKTGKSFFQGSKNMDPLVLRPCVVTGKRDAKLVLLICVWGWLCYS